MARLNVNFNVGRVIERSRKATARGLDRLADEMEKFVRRGIAKRISPPRSKPGSPIHKETGALASSVKIVRKGRRITLQLENYGVFHDQGIRYPTRGPRKGSGPKVKRRVYTGVILGPRGGLLGIWRDQANRLIRAEMEKENQGPPRRRRR